MRLRTCFAMPTWPNGVETLQLTDRTRGKSAARLDEWRWIPRDRWRHGNACRMFRPHDHRRVVLVRGRPGGLRLFRVSLRAHGAGGCQKAAGHQTASDTSRLGDHRGPQRGTPNSRKDREHARSGLSAGESGDYRRLRLFERCHRHDCA